MIYLLLFIAILVGSLMPIQAGINTQLSRLIQNPFLGAFISFSTGVITLGALLLIKGFPHQEIKRLGLASPHLFLGGVLGAIFVGSTIFFIPKIGATNMIASFITGQLIMSILIDHFGLFGAPVQTLNMYRIVGVFLLFAGLMLVVKKST
ncbi:MAG: DMT family transporter [Bacteriovoracaceae bacterium]